MITSASPACMTACGNKMLPQEAYSWLVNRFLIRRPDAMFNIARSASESGSPDPCARCIQAGAQAYPMDRHLVPDSIFVNNVSPNRAVTAET